MSAPWSKTGGKGLAAAFTITTAAAAAAAIYTTGTTEPYAVVRTLGLSGRYVLEWGFWAFNTPNAQALHALSLEHAAPAALAVAAIATAPVAALAIAKAFRSTSYGSSFWGTARDIKPQGLAGKHGQVLGKLDGRILRPAEPRHVLLIAPTRRGKTAGPVITSILDWPGSLVVLDQKPELADITARARAKRGPVHIVDWADPSTPQAWCPTAPNVTPNEPHEIERHAARLAGVFFPESEGENAYFTNQARRYATALWQFEIHENKRLGRSRPLGAIFNDLQEIAPHIDAAGSDDDEQPDPLQIKLLEIAEEARLRGYPRHITLNLQTWATSSYRERRRDLSTVLTHVQETLYLSVEKSTGSADFEWPDLRAKPTTVYLRAPIKDRTAFGKLNKIFLDSLFSWALSNPDGQPILVIADEFRSLPRLEMLPEVLTAGAGQGLTIQIVVQEWAQLKIRYKEEGSEEIFTNCTHVVAYGQNNVATQRKLTEAVGKFTRRKLSSSRRFGETFGSTSSAEEGRELVPVEAWGSIPFGRAVVLTDGFKTTPLFVKVPFWWTRRAWRRQIPRRFRRGIWRFLP